MLGFNLPSAAVAAHLAALHRLTQQAGGQGEVGGPAQWCVRVLEVAEGVLGQAMDARGNLVSVQARKYPSGMPLLPPVPIPARLGVCTARSVVVVGICKYAVRRSTSLLLRPV